jgi:hypothetical protein
MFQPFSTSYFVRLDNIILENSGLVSITKRMFFPFLKTTWDEAL